MGIPPWNKRLDYQQLQLLKNVTLSSSSFLENEQTVEVVLKYHKLDMNKEGFNSTYKKTTLHGTQCWSKSSQIFAIWYLPNQNIWMIGDKEKVGEDTGYLCAKNADNSFSGLTALDNEWKYWNGTSFISPSDPTDIVCVDKALYGKNSRLILLT